MDKRKSILLTVASADYHVRTYVVSDGAQTRKLIAADLNIWNVMST